MLEICEDHDHITFTEEEFNKAVSNLNKGKSPDIYGMTAEHLVHAGSHITRLICDIMNAISTKGCIPDKLNIGTFTPVYKKIGDKNNSRHYRGFTISSVLLKIIETQGSPTTFHRHNAKTNCRGFTANTSPLLRPVCATCGGIHNRKQRLETTSVQCFSRRQVSIYVVSHDILRRKATSPGDFQ